MSVTQYRLSWDSYKSNVCDGFTKLQQNEELVDMTIAADGHLVKVHKSIFALASPYIKSMLQSTPNEHPVIFLGNISHEVLNYILTYVYTGEVSVEVDKIQLFMNVAKDLQLSGLFGIPTPKVGPESNVKKKTTEQKYEDNSIMAPEIASEDMVTENANLFDNISAPESALTNIELLDTRLDMSHVPLTNMENIVNNPPSSEINIFKEPHNMVNEEIQNNRDSGLYVTADGYQYKLEIQQPNSMPIVDNTLNNTSEMMQACNIKNITVTSNDYKSYNFESFENEFKNKVNATSLDPKAITLLYTMSTRGSLQLILNRYMYHCHHQSHGGRKRRWRCIEYRDKHCPAFIDTDGEIMTSRKFGHCHSFHDEKIRKKMKRNLVFTNLNVLLQKQRNKSKKNPD